MPATLVIEVKNGKVKVDDLANYRELQRRIALALDGVETVSAFEGEGACEEACREHGGVDVCGETFALCNDGNAYLLDP